MPDTKLNPATKILIWLGFAVSVQGFGFPLLALATAISALPLVALRDSGTLIMLRRARWLLLSLLLIYSYATPGNPVLPALGTFSPSLQGLQDGGLQAWRLALLLVTLALLLHACPRENLLSGIYTLLRPFRIMGLNPERVAVRLWLTLRYADQQPRKGIQAWWHELRSSTDTVPDAVTHVSLELPPFTWRDITALAVATLLIGLALW